MLLLLLRQVLLRHVPRWQILLRLLLLLLQVVLRQVVLLRRQRRRRQLLRVRRGSQGGREAGLLRAAMPVGHQQDCWIPARRGHGKRRVGTKHGPPHRGVQHSSAVHRVWGVHRAAKYGMLRQGAVELRMRRVHRRDRPGGSGGRLERAVDESRGYSRWALRHARRRAASKTCGDGYAAGGRTLVVAGGRGQAGTYLHTAVRPRAWVGRALRRRVRGVGLVHLGAGVEAIEPCERTGLPYGIAATLLGEGAFFMDAPFLLRNGPPGP